MRFGHNGKSLNVARNGTGGIPVLFQHGLGGDAEQVRSIFPQTDRFDAVTLECDGHGLSAWPDPPEFSLHAYLDEVSAFATRNLPSPHVIGGISMGAALALATAVTQPEQVSALVLVRPAWFDQKRPANLESIRFVGALLLEYDQPEALRRFRNSDIARSIRDSSPDNYATLIDYLNTDSPTMTGHMLASIAADGFEWTAEQIGALRIPTLVIGVDRDDIHPFELARQLSQAIPGAILLKAPEKADVTRKPNYYEFIAQRILEFLSGQNLRQSFG